jgi:hypothetical protein
MRVIDEDTLSRAAHQCDVTADARMKCALGKPKERETPAGDEEGGPARRLGIRVLHEVDRLLGGSNVLGQRKYNGIGV